MTIDLTLPDAPPFATGLELRISCGESVSAFFTTSDGKKISRGPVGRFPVAAPGFLLEIQAATGTGEFWTDVSMLHSRGKAAAGDDALAGTFDFDWLFSRSVTEDEADPVLALRPQMLTKMVEAQARIVAMSPAIEIVDI